MLSNTTSSEFDETGETSATERTLASVGRRDGPIARVPDAPNSFAGRIANLRSVHCAIRRCLFMSLQHGVQRTMGPDASAMAAGRPFLAVSHPARARYRATPDRPAFPPTSSVVGQSAWPACQPAVGVPSTTRMPTPCNCRRRAIVKERSSGLGRGIGRSPGCRKQGVPRGDHDDHRVSARTQEWQEASRQQDRAGKIHRDLLSDAFVTDRPIQ